MKKNIIMILLAVVFLVVLLPSINALTFDNRLKSYDSETETIVIDDWFGAGPDLVKVTMLSNTDKCLTACQSTWNVTIYADDDNLLSELLFESLSQDEVNITHTFELLDGYSTITVDDWVRDDKNEVNGVAPMIRSGNHQERVENWISFDPRKKLAPGNYIIKLRGIKEWEQTVDWIPTFYGQQIRQWAFWAGIAPTTVWEFDEAVNSDTANDTLALHNLTTNITAGNFTSGLLSNAWWSNTSTGSQISLNGTAGPEFAFGTGNFTVAIWINTNYSGGGYNPFELNGLGTGWRLTQGSGGNNFTFVAAASEILRTEREVGDGLWHRVVFVRENGGADGFKAYFDNENTNNVTFSTDISNDTAGPEFFGPNAAGQLGIDSFQIYKGFAWDVADVNTDFNGSTGRNAGSPDISTLASALNSPTNNTQTSVSSLVFNATATPAFTNLTNATIRVYNSSTNLFNQSNISVTGQVVNESSFTIPSLVRGTYFWNVEFCGDLNNGTSGSLCADAVSNFTFSVTSSDIASSFSEFTYETAEETYQTNVTLLPGDTITSVNLIYNGTSTTATSSNIAGNNFSLTATIDVPISAVGQNTTQWFFSLNLNTGQDNLTPHNQSVGAINLSLFGQGIGGLPYVNFTFSNETVAEESVSASFSSTWSYFLGSGTVNKTLNFVNASENFNYSFQFHPQNRTLMADLTTDYSNSESQQRTFNPTTLTLTNNTLLQVLFLLPTSDGIFQQFVTQTAIGNTVTNVNFVINRTIGGTSQELASGATDGSGFASIFLNPDFTHTAIFTKTGFTPNAFSFQPSNQLRTVIMGGAITGVTNGSTISVNTTYQIQPINTSLGNGTDFVFSLNVTSSQPINLISMNITNASGFQVGFQTATSATFISQTINTGENVTFVGTFNIATQNETITVTRIWNIGQSFVGDYSIFRQFSLYTTYGFRDFIRFIIAVFLIGGVLVFMSTGEVIDTSESKIGVALLLVWAFSIVGWLTIPGPPVVSANATITALAQFSNQYGIAIISTGAGVFFVGRRVFT